MVEVKEKAEQRKKQTSPETIARFGRVLTGFAIADAVMILFLTFGFVLPQRISRNTEPGGMPADFYDYSGKISPFTPPAPDPVIAKVEIPKITARGDNPTFVPAENATLETPGDPAADSRVDNEPTVQPVSMERSRHDADMSDGPAHVESPDVYRVQPAAVNRSSPSEMVPTAILSTPVRRDSVESPIAATGARVESVDQRRTTMSLR